MRQSRIVFVAIITLIIFFSGKFSTTLYKFPELRYFPKMPQSASNPVTVEGAELGRYLFYDPILSSDSTISCSSCHNQSFAFSDSPNDFSKGRNGKAMKRNTMPLFNLAWYPSMFWDGRANTIEEQIFHPIMSDDEMNLRPEIAAERLNRSSFYKNKFASVFGSTEIDTIEIAKAVAQFLRTLISHQSKYDRIINGNGYFTKDEYAGFILMNDQTKGDCLHCHSTDANALGTTLKFSNNGLDSVIDPNNYKDKGRGEATGKITDNGKFIIPTLRNVEVTAPYMHDGRFKTLEEVLEFYSFGVKQCANIDSKMEFAHSGGTNLSADEQRKIVLFLKTFTDSVFIANPEFGNPFN